MLGRYSGADLAGLVREAAMTVLRRVTVAASATSPDAVATVGVTGLQVTGSDFEEALTRIRPSVSREDELEYERLYGVKSWSKLPANAAQ